MTREDEAAIALAWHAYTDGRPIDGRTYFEFLDSRIRTQSRFERCSVFEILDVLANCEPEPHARRESA
jgi:hypothetical protein